MDADLCCTLSMPSEHEETPIFQIKNRNIVKVAESFVCRDFLQAIFMTEMGSLV